MGKIVTRNRPCLDTIKCGSSDARQIYENGTSFCFACQGWFPAKEGEVFETVETVTSKTDFFKKQVTADAIKAYKTTDISSRGISKGIAEQYGVKMTFDSDGEVDTHYYPYEDGKAYKIRKLPKDFTWVGKSTDLFGRGLFSGGGKRVIIVEGEIDTLSMAQANWDKYQRLYPVVGLSSSVMTKSLLENREWLRTFGEVVLCFDNDEAGKKATDDAIKIIGIDKAKIAKYPKDCKDSNDVLLKFGSPRLLQCVFDSQPWSPAGIISKEDIWKQITERNALVSVPYPACLEGVNKKIKGMRLGEIALFISGTGSGKSTVVREIELHLLETTNDKIGVISLEESPGETGIKLSGMAIHKNPSHNEIPDEELKVGFDKVFGTDRVVVLDHQGSIKDDSIIDQLEYMCLIGCKYLFIDHITILVSEGADGLTGNEAIDKIMNDLLRLVKRHNVYICLISHLRKVQTGGKSFEEGRIPSLDDIRGSGSIKQVSFDVIAFARDMNNAEEYVRNTICMAVLKSRTMALTGPVPGAVYDNITGRLTAFNGADEEFTKV
jgi:twinkle protein